MKNTIYILSFLMLSAFFAPVLHAQSIEQISYIPVKRGNYKQLMVKKRAYFGGDLTVRNTLTSHATFLNMTANNSLTFSGNPSINVNNNVFLSGTNLSVTNAVRVYSGNILTIRAGTKTEIDRATGTTTMYSQNLNLSNANTRINSLYIDGLLYPSSCAYIWQSNVETAGGGKYTILKCAD